MWKKPWKLKEGCMIGAGLVITGCLLQLSTGPVRWELFASPVNFIVLCGLLAVVAAGYAMRCRVYAASFLLTGSAAVAAIAYAAFLTVLMGLVLQTTDRPTDRLGFTHMLSCWPFVLVYLWMTVIAGMVTLHHFVLLAGGKRTSLSAWLSHTGFFVALVCGVLGHADMQRLKMSVKTGQPEWRVQDAKGDITELPLAIELHEFSIEEYPMQAVVIDNATGKTVNDSDWRLTLTEKLEQAAPNVIDSATVDYVAWHSVGAASAAYVLAHNRRDGVTKEGWISCGSFAFPYQGLKLDELYSAVMPEREPKKFSSVVTVYTRTGNKLTDTILVNRPLDIEGWRIYQLSYDETLGRWSDVSIFELVRDPWLPAVYAGIILMLAGAVLMFLRNGKKGGYL